MTERRGTTLEPANGPGGEVGKVVRELEISPEVADHPRSVITDQVTNGVAVRMALLYLLAGAGARSAPDGAAAAGQRVEGGGG